MDTLRYYINPLVTGMGVLGFVLGGPWVWLGAATFPVLMVFDILLPRDFAPRHIGSGLAADIPMYLQLPLMIAMYVAFLIGVRTGAIDLHATSVLLGSIFSIGWLSGVPTLPAAHELMHRRHWFPRQVAQYLCTFFGQPNRDTAHVLTHHIHLDTAKDSDTPRRGQTIYGFVVQATRGALMDAVRHEAEVLRRRGYSPWNWRNRTYQEVALLLVIPVVSLIAAGPMAMLVSVAALLFAKAIVEGFNYFQHYGLLRVEGQPIRLHHAWNHMGTIVRPLGAEITNHINHHLDGFTPFYELKPEPDAPQMPSLFLCFLAGLVPPLWFNLIAKPRLQDWDLRYASEAERALAREANAKAGWPDWTQAQQRVTA